MFNLQSWFRSHSSRKASLNSHQSPRDKLPSAVATSLKERSLCFLTEQWSKVAILFHLCEKTPNIEKYLTKRVTKRKKKQHIPGYKERTFIPNVVGLFAANSDSFLPNNGSNKLNLFLKKQSLWKDYTRQGVALKFIINALGFGI